MTDPIATLNKKTSYAARNKFAILTTDEIRKAWRRFKEIRFKDGENGHRAAEFLNMMDRDAIIDELLERLD